MIAAILFVVINCVIFRKIQVFFAIDSALLVQFARKNRFRDQPRSTRTTIISYYSYRRIGLCVHFKGETRTRIRFIHVEFCRETMISYNNNN